MSWLSISRSSSPVRTARSSLPTSGADVLKVEKPGLGDDMRSLKMAEIEGGDSAPFLWANRNKRSVALDLSQPAGRGVAFDLVSKADVVVENFSAGVMARFGLDYETVASANPQLIYCSISAAGRDGTLSTRVAFDPISQAETGFIALNTVPGDPRRALQTPIADLTTGMMAASAILAAIASRSTLGRGQLVEVAMFDQGINLLSYHGLNYLISGMEPTAVAERSPGPVGVFATRDDDLYVCCANDRTFRRLVIDVLSRPELADDPRFSTLQARLTNSLPFLTIVSEEFARDELSNWLARLRASGVPAAPVASVGEALTSPEVAERRLVSQIPHPVAGSVPNVASPIRMGLTPVVDPVVAPSLGAHTDEVLTGTLGYAPDTIEALGLAGAFGPHGLKPKSGTQSAGDLGPLDVGGRQDRRTARGG